MPSQKPRIALTLPPELRTALYDLADAWEKPAATIATELLVEMIPQLEGLAKMTRAVKAGNKSQAKRALVHMVGDQFANLMASQTPDMFPAKKAKKRP